jgi:hypothetical protein
MTGNYSCPATCITLSIYNYPSTCPSTCRPRSTCLLLSLSILSIWKVVTVDVPAPTCIIPLHIKHIAVLPLSEASFHLVTTLYTIIFCVTVSSVLYSKTLPA